MRRIMPLTSWHTSSLAGERTRLVELLVREFPDVFAFPRPTTTRPANERDLFALSAAELAAHEAEKAQKEAAKAAAAAGPPLPIPPGSPNSRPITPGSPLRSARTTMSGQGGVGGAGSEAGGAEGEQKEGEAQEPLETPLYPEPNYVSSQEFDELVAQGKLLEHHTDLFTHPLATHRTGFTLEAIREVGDGLLAV